MGYRCNLVRILISNSTLRLNAHRAHISCSIYVIQYLEEHIMGYTFNTDYTVSCMYLHALGDLDSLHTGIIRYGILLVGLSVRQVCRGTNN